MLTLTEIQRNVSLYH